VIRESRAVDVASNKVEQRRAGTLTSGTVNDEPPIEHVDAA
jgi:hypothetical protein